ncbi:MAG: hypothetical protein PHT80_06705 [Lentisphaeria bacterium]|nr:hypothetical protein [Lentisphaeria bacterium]
MTRREVLKSGVRVGLLALMGIGVVRVLRQAATEPAQDGVRRGCEAPGACGRCRLASRCPRQRSAGRGG